MVLVTERWKEMHLIGLTEKRREKIYNASRLYIYVSAVTAEQAIQL